MAIVFRDGNIDGGNKTSFTPTEDAGAAENDFMLMYGFLASTDGTWTFPADFTQIDQFSETAGAADARVFIGRKVRGATAGNGYNMTYSGTAGNGSVCLISYRGSQALDLTYVKASHYDNTIDSMNAAAKAITTVTNNAMVVLCQMISNTAITTFGAPSSYSQRKAASGINRNIYACDRIIATADTETPGAYTHTGDDTQDQRQFTIALRESVAAGAGMYHHLRNLGAY